MTVYRFIRDYRSAIARGESDAEFEPTCQLCHGESESCSRCGGRLGMTPGQALKRVNDQRNAKYRTRKAVQR